MKASKFSDAQKAFILKQGAGGMPVADICCQSASNFGSDSRPCPLPSRSPTAGI